MVTQTVYDDPDFRTRYEQLDRSVHGLNGAPEWATLQSMLPTLDGLRVIDLHRPWFLLVSATRTSVVQ